MTGEQVFISGNLHINYIMKRNSFIAKTYQKVCEGIKEL